MKSNQIKLSGHAILSIHFNTFNYELETPKNPLLHNWKYTTEASISRQPRSAQSRLQSPVTLGLDRVHFRSQTSFSDLEPDLISQFCCWLGRTVKMYFPFPSVKTVRRHITWTDTEISNYASYLLFFLIWKKYLTFLRLVYPISIKMLIIIVSNILRISGHSLECNAYFQSK